MKETIFFCKLSWGNAIKNGVGYRMSRFQEDKSLYEFYDWVTIQVNECPHQPCIAENIQFIQK